MSRKQQGERSLLVRSFAATGQRPEFTRHHKVHGSRVSRLIPSRTPTVATPTGRHEISEEVAPVLEDIETDSI